MFAIISAIKTIIMLSVNIPVYNIDVNELALQLVQQVQELGNNAEIRIYDDGSDDSVKKKNRQVSGLPGVKYIELKDNLGRSAIRNKMGLDSQRNYLLFIDADSKLVSADYLKKYLDMASPGCVLCGGTTYRANPPSDSNKLLRWVYGTKREAVQASERSSNKSFIITSNNFLIDRQVFSKIHFREDLGPYGHEDTLLGYDLFANGIHPVHADNPVEHTGLEDSATFLRKSRDALRNLHMIATSLLADDSTFSQRVTFLNKYNAITRYVPPAILRASYKLLRRHLEKNLTGRKPAIILFDLYRLLYYSTLQRKSV